MCDVTVLNLLFSDWRFFFVFYLFIYFVFSLLIFWWLRIAFMLIKSVFYGSFFIAVSDLFQSYYASNNWQGAS